MNEELASSSVEPKPKKQKIEPVAKKAWSIRRKNKTTRPSGTKQSSSQTSTAIPEAPLALPKSLSTYSEEYSSIASSHTNLDDSSPSSQTFSTETSRSANNIPHTSTIAEPAPLQPIPNLTATSLGSSTPLLALTPSPNTMTTTTTTKTPYKIAFTPISTIASLVSSPITPPALLNNNSSAPISTIPVNFTITTPIAISKTLPPMSNYPTTPSLYNHPFTDLSTSKDTTTYHTPQKIISYTPISHPAPGDAKVANPESSDIGELECSVEDLEPVEPDTKDVESTHHSRRQDDEASHPRKAGLTHHLENIINKRMASENKLQLPSIAKRLQVSDYKEYLSSAFNSSIVVLSEKQQKRKESELKKRKPNPIDYVEEIRAMMHSFGDVSTSLKESAQLLEMVASKYLIVVLSLIMEVLPPNWKNTEVPIEAVAVAMLPDVKKVHKIQQWIAFISQGRNFAHAEEMTRATEGTGGTADDNHSKLGVQALEAITDEAKAKPRASDDSITILFSGNDWQKRLETAREEVHVEKLARAAARDILSTQFSKDDYTSYADCAKASFTKPNKRSKFEQFIQTHCMTKNQALCFSPITLDILGMLTRELVEEVVIGALEKRAKTKKTALEPIDIVLFLTGLVPKPTR